MNILVVTPDYPDRYKVHYPFVKQLVDEFARQGHHCFVIAPYSITKNKRRYQEIDKTSDNITILRPNYLSFSNFRVGKFSPSLYFRQMAIKRALSHLPVNPDVVYCHFWESALEGYSYSKENGIPLFVASGESCVSTLLNDKQIPSDLNDYVSGVICVSTKNMEESVSLRLITEDKCLVKPNAVNGRLFKKLDRNDCRQKLGFPQDAFIVSFVGAFIERKGVLRVAKAIKQIKGEPVYSCFIGRGRQDPDCDNILHKGGLLHEDIPVYLNASDVFVLPTLAEGCCNAVVEAMSCGLPIISSNLPFNWDVLDEDNSIMIDPQNVDAIADAIVRLRDNKQLRDQMAESSLQKASSLTIDQRASDIIEFIKTKM